MGGHSLAGVRLAVLMFSVLAWGATAAEVADPQEAELKLLRATVERQAREIEALKQRVAELTRQLGEQRATAAATPATQPAATARQAKKVLFVVDACGRMTYFDWVSVQKEVARAAEELGPEQTFNIFMHSGHGVVAMQKGNYVVANDANRRRAATFLGVSPGGASHLDEALRIAGNYEPDLLWVISVGDVKDPDAVLKQVREWNAKGRTRINTTIAFAGHMPPACRHFLWRLAKENGGTCLGKDGKEVDEPVVPTVVAPPTPPPPPRRPGLIPVQ